MQKHKDIVAKFTEKLNQRIDSLQSMKARVMELEETKSSKRRNQEQSASLLNKPECREMERTKQRRENEDMEQ